MQSRPVRTIATIVLLALAPVSCSQSRAGAIADVDGLAERGGDAVWQVESAGCGWKMRGSAFAIDARHLVTNRHVIANDTSPLIRSRSGKERKGKVIGASAQPDVAVIEVAEDLPAHLLWAATPSLSDREPLVVLGYPSPEYAFNASTGRIVNFQGPRGTREAALVNAPIARGNSGGPGLRGDASVAGVVTQLTIPDRRGEQVAILFTADAVGPTVTRFLRQPSKVLSTCGLGPDYVPPLPKNYNIKQPPPTAAPLEALPVPSVAPGRAPFAAPASRPSPDRVVTKTPVPSKPPACPRGVPGLEVTTFTSSQQPDQPSWWRIDVRGSVRNNSSSRILVESIEVTVAGDPPITRKANRWTSDVVPGAQGEWAVEEQYVHSPGNQPTRAKATMEWEWTNSSGQSFNAVNGTDCRSDSITSSGPNATASPT